MVSIPTGLHKSFRPFDRLAMRFTGGSVSIPTGLHKSFRHWLGCSSSEQPSSFNPHRASQVIPTESVLLFYAEVPDFNPHRASQVIPTASSWSQMTMCSRSFQSPPGFTSHSDVTNVIRAWASVSFQSPPGFTSHSDRP